MRKQLFSATQADVNTLPALVRMMTVSATHYLHVYLTPENVPAYVIFTAPVDDSTVWTIEEKGYVQNIANSPFIRMFASQILPRINAPHLNTTLSNEWLQRFGV